MDDQDEYTLSQDIVENPKKVCKNKTYTPLYVYIGLMAFFIFFSLLQIIFQYQIDTNSFYTAIGSAIFNLLIILLVGVIIYFLCKECHSGWAWFVLFIPVIIWFLILLVFTLVNILFFGVISS